MSNEESKKPSAPQSRKFACVIEGHIKETDKTFTPSAIESSIKVLSIVHGAHYWLIAHDRDLNKETGELKRLHYHLVLDFPSRHTKTAVIKMLQFQLDIPKEAISVRISDSLNHDIRYLTHMDYLEEGKVAYHPSEVMTDDQSTFEKALEDSADRLTTAYVFEVAKTSKNIEEVIKRLGVNQYLRYRMVIRDLRAHYLHGVTL